jgi:hypothetical protein
MNTLDKKIYQAIADYVGNASNEFSQRINSLQQRREYDSLKSQLNEVQKLYKSSESQIAKDALKPAIDTLEAKMKEQEANRQPVGREIVVPLLVQSSKGKTVIVLPVHYAGEAVYAAKVKDAIAKEIGIPNDARACASGTGTLAVYNAKIQKGRLEQAAKTASRAVRDANVSFTVEYFAIDLQECGAAYKKPQLEEITKEPEKSPAAAPVAKAAPAVQIKTVKQKKERMYCIADVAKETKKVFPPRGYSKGAIISHIKAGHIDAVKKGRRYFVSQSSLDAYVAKLTLAQAKKTIDAGAKAIIIESLGKGISPSDIASQYRSKGYEIKIQDVLDLKKELKADTYKTPGKSQPEPVKNLAAIVAEMQKLGKNVKKGNNWERLKKKFNIDGRRLQGIHTAFVIQGKGKDQLKK